MLRTNLDKWIECSTELGYGQKPYENVEMLSVAHESAEKACWLVQNMTEIGSLVIHPETILEILVLKLGLGLLSKFADGIHEDIYSKIDSTFFEKISNNLSLVYELNPNKYEFHVYDVSFKLDGLLNSMITDDKLKSDFDAFYANLNEDDVVVFYIFNDDYSIEDNLL